MVRILLADDSPHAQRMGERILRDEGYDVVTIADGESAMQRLAEYDPDVIVADIHMPRRSGYEICRIAKADRKYVRVVLTAGLLEPVDDAEVRNSGSDGLLKKPFEATAVLDTIRPLAAQAQAARGLAPDEQQKQTRAKPFKVEPLNTEGARSELTKRGTFQAAAVATAPAALQRPSGVPPPIPGAVAGPAPTAVELERERVEAAVVLAVELAMERAMPGLIREITDRVMASLKR